MPVYQQIPATFDGNNISTISSLTTDGTEKIAAYGHYGTAL
jgi:hypothetical protein